LLALLVFVTSLPSHLLRLSGIYCSVVFQNALVHLTFHVLFTSTRAGVFVYIFARGFCLKPAIK